MYNIDMPSETNYYEVELNLPATWSNSSYTYRSGEHLKVGQIVKVPFGNSTKIGFISNKVVKPTIETKPIAEALPAMIPNAQIKLSRWMKSYYPGPGGSINSHFLPSLISSIKDFKTTTTPFQPKDIDPPLNKEQLGLYETIIKSDKSSVIYGVTGSGKTRLYAEITNKIIKSKNVLILYPEISLSSQTKRELSKYIDEKNIHDFNSKQTPTEQRNTWLAAINSKSGNLFIGTRSALFLPISNLGLIVVDEAHDSSYKQDSGSRYGSLGVAAALAKLSDAKFVIGSATPPVQETFQILSKGGQLLRLSKTAIETNPSNKHVGVVDMNKKTNLSNYRLFSKKLVSAIEDSLDKGEQSLVYLNKRGTAKIIQCENCGWNAKCNNCELPLTYHHDKFNLQCHVCGVKKVADILCPDCSHSLTQKSHGVKTIENELAKLFPSAKVARFDSDNTKAESLAVNYESVKSGEIDIIIGTQLITKGMDLPKLSTVGVINSESSLLLPDYTSEERTFQELVQVSGRVGRGHTDGKVILQSHQPDNPLLKYVTDQDWESFYAQELKRREQLGFPPYKFAAKIWASRNTLDSTVKTIESVAKSISKRELTILGPAPSFYEKIGRKFNWQIIIMANKRSTLVNAVKNLPKDVYFDLDPTSLL